MESKKVNEGAIEQVAGDTRRFVAEASELGLAPGEWPEHIEVGNIQLKRVGVDRGNVGYHSSMYGISLMVFND